MISATVLLISQQGLAADVQVNSVTAGDQIAPSVAIGGNSVVVVSWGPTFDDPDGNAYARSFSLAGESLGAQYSVSGPTDGRQSYPDVAACGAGGFIVAWSFSDYNLGTTLVEGRLLSLAGDDLGPLVATETPGFSTAVSRAGGFVVTWPEVEDATNDHDIAARAFDSFGNPTTDKFRINSQVAGDQTDVDIAAISNEKYVVVWSGPDAEGRGIWASFDGPQIFADGFESGNSSGWSVSLPLEGSYFGATLWNVLVE